MIVFLAKVFQYAKYADDFVEGKLYANRLAYFKKLEDSGVRGDQDEGAIMPQSDDLTIDLTATNQSTGETSNIRTSGNELADPLVMRPEWFDHINVFCMYAGHTGDLETVSEKNVAAFKKQLEIPEECEQLGKYAVIIKNTSEFFRRVKEGAKRKGYGFRRGLVNYYDAKLGSPATREPLDTIFTKRKEFEYQKEYRLTINTGTLGCNPITLDIGKIDDIAVCMDSGEINRQIDIKVKRP